MPNRLKFAPLGLVLAMGMASASTLTFTTSYDYDADGFLISEIHEPANPALRQEITYTRDVYGHVSTTKLSTADAARTTRNTYGYGGRFVVASQNALNQESRMDYNTHLGLPSSSTDLNGLVTRFEYDALGRKVKEIHPNGNQTRWEYTLCNGSCPGNGGSGIASYVITQTPLASDGTSPNGAWSKSYYDDLDRVIRTETQGFNAGDVIVSLTQYDALGRVAQSSRPFYAGQTIYWNVSSYDSLSRNILATAADGSTIRTVYNGLTTTVTNANNQSTSKTVNSQGKLVQVVNALKQTQRFVYDPQGQMLQAIDPKGNQIVNTYDLFGHRLTMQDPDLGSLTATYNGFGEKVTETDASGQTVTFRYDALGRTISRGEPDLVSTWTYDSCPHGIGMLCQSSSDNGYSHTIGYDEYSRPQLSTTVLNTTYTASNTFDANGRVISQSYPTGFSVNYTYTPTGYLSEIRNAQTNQRYWQANSMDAEGHQLLETYGDSLLIDQRFNPANGRPQQILAGAGNGILNLSYQFDKLGNLANRTDGNLNVVETFLYDEVNRITNTQGAGLPSITYTYDELGNLASRSDVGTYTYGTRPHAVASISGIVNATFSYDSNGNQISGNGRTLSYSSFDLPTQIQKGSWTDRFLFGPEHQRIQQISNSGTIYYLNPDNVGGLLFEREVKPDGVVENRHFINAGGTTVALYTTKSDGSSDLKYWFKDNQGSLTAVTDETGNVIERLSYEAFGKRRYPNGQPDPQDQITGKTTDRGYTGHEHLDEVGLIHMNGRVYDPLLARFLSADPNITDPETLQSYNRYSYVQNNPFFYTDPSGFDETNSNSESDPTDHDSEHAKNSSSNSTVSHSTWRGFVSKLVGAFVPSAHAAGAEVEEQEPRWGLFEPENSVIAYRAVQAIEARIQVINPGYRYQRATAPGWEGYTSEDIEIVREAEARERNLVLRDKNSNVSVRRAIESRQKFEENIEDQVTHGRLNRKVPTIEEIARDLVDKNAGRHRVELRSENVRFDIDLAGKAHNGIPTPHTRISQRNTQAPESIQPAYNTTGKQAIVRPSTNEDIRMVRRFMKGKE